MNISELLQALKLNPETLTMYERLLAGMAVTILSMSVVFIVLVVIQALIKMMNFSPNKIKKDEIYEREEVLSSVSYKNEDLINDTQLVAVITAAIMASGSKNIVVRKIVRSNNNYTNWEKIQ